MATVLYSTCYLELSVGGWLQCKHKGGGICGLTFQQICVMANVLYDDFISSATEQLSYILYRRGACVPLYSLA